MTVTTAEYIMAAATRAVRTGRNFDTGPHLPGAAPFRAPHRHAEVRPGIGQRDISETPWWYRGSHGVMPRTVQSSMARSGHGVNGMDGPEWQRERAAGGAARISRECRMHRLARAVVPVLTLALALPLVALGASQV